MEQLIGPTLGKEEDKTVYCHLVHLTYMQSTSCEMMGCVNHWLEFTARRNSNTLRYADDMTLVAKSEEELKSLL